MHKLYSLNWEHAIGYFRFIKDNFRSQSMLKHGHTSYSWFFIVKIEYSNKVSCHAMPISCYCIFKSINVILFKMHLDNGNDNDNDNEKRDVGMAEQFSGMVSSLKHTPS